ncbi:hypothetical protein MYCO108962_19260 [Mycobacterium colombiense]
MADQPHAGAVDHDVMAAREEEEFVSPGLEEDELEQRPGERHGRALNGQRSATGFLLGIGRIAQVEERQLDVWVLDRPLDDLAVDLEEGDPGRFRLVHGLPDRPLQGVALDHAVDPHEQAELPLGVGVARFLRKPYVQLSARQRKCLALKLHPTPQQQGVPFNPPG